MSTHRPAAGAPSHVPLLLHNPTLCQGKEEAKESPRGKEKEKASAQGTPVLQPPVLERFPLGCGRLVNLRRTRHNHRVKTSGIERWRKGEAGFGGCRTWWRSCDCSDWEMKSGT